LQVAIPPELDDEPEALELVAPWVVVSLAELQAARPIEAATNTPSIDPKRIVHLHREREGRSLEPREG
jgi:hypothetical protein